MQPESASIEANSLRFHYLRWRASGDRGPIVLNHATGFLAALWQPVAERLAAAGYDCFAYDARGHGDSDKPAPTDANYHWQHLTDDLEAVLATLSLRDVPFVGHSSGGAAGLYLAGTRPGLLSRLALIEPIVMPGGFQPDETRRNDMADAARRRRQTFPSRDEMIDQYRSRAAFQRWTPVSLRLYADQGTFETEDGAIQLKCPGEIEGAVFANSASLNIWDILPQIDVPTLVIAGELTEGFLDMVAQGVAQRIPNGRYLKLPEAGHLAPMERPETVAAEILTFLSNQP
jgi:pimeloyl-ACP methyl ester carboxylesterase